MSSRDAWETQQVSLAGLPGADNNPNFAFQIVAEFESSAILGSPNNYYVTAPPFPQPYATTGVSRFDPVTIYGTPPLPPEIVTDPQSQYVVTGSNATFTVATTGSAPFGYQWSFAGSAIPGATASSHTVASADPTHAGPYYVIVTNFAGSVTSAVARLAVLVDIGLRVFDGAATNRIACEVPAVDGVLLSPLRIAKTGTNYGIGLTDPPPAGQNPSKFQMQTPAGLKAWQRLP